MLHRTRRTIPALLALFAAGAVHAQAVNIPDGALFKLGDGELRLACATVTVAGLLDGGNGVVDEAGDVYIVDGTISGGDADFFVSGGWNNGGTFIPGTSLVEFNDECTLDTTISGDNTFHDLRFTSSGGKTFLLQAGSTQTVQHSLSVEEDAGLASTDVSNPAYIDARSAVVSIAGLVGASVIFLGSAVAAIPVLSVPFLALLAALLVFSAPALRRRSGTPSGK